MKITERKLRSIIKSVIKESRFDDADRYDHDIQDKKYAVVSQGIGISEVMTMSIDELTRLSPNEKYRITTMLDDEVSNLQDEIDLLNNKRDEISQY